MRRGSIVRLTPAGRSAIKAAAPNHVATVRRLFLDPLSDDELDTLATLFDRLLAGLADTDVQKCQVTRAWNWAMSKTDIVNDLAVVPDSTIKDVMAVYSAGGLKMKPVLKAIFTADDFVKF